MAKVEFSKQEGKPQLPKEWQAYQWAIDEVEKHFESVRWQLMDYDNHLAVGVRDKLKHRQHFFLKRSYHGPNAKLRELGYTPDRYDGEERLDDYEDPDWQEYDLMKSAAPRLALNKIIATIKSQFTLKQQGVF